MKTSRSIEASKGADPSHSGHGVEASRASSSDDGTAQRGGSLLASGLPYIPAAHEQRSPCKISHTPGGQGLPGGDPALPALPDHGGAPLQTPRSCWMWTMHLPMTVSSGFGNVRLEPPDAGHQHAGQAAVRAAQGPGCHRTARAHAVPYPPWAPTHCILPTQDTSFSRQASLGIPPHLAWMATVEPDAKQLQNSIAGNAVTHFLSVGAAIGEKVCIM